VTVLIFNVGFTAEYVIRAISRRSIAGVNKIFLVAMESKDEYSQKRSSEAIGAILDFLRIAGVTDVDVVKVNVDWSFDAILEYVSEKIGGYDDYEFHLVGGTRMTLLALYYLALLLSAMPGVKVKAIAYDEAMTSSKELPLRVPSVPTKEKLDVLEAIGAGATVTGLARALNKSPSTVSLQLTSLKEEGLITAEREGRKKDVELTPLGRAVLNLMKKAVKEKAGSSTSPQGGSTRV
jgi:CRISPR-associated protein Csa3